MTLMSSVGGGKSGVMMGGGSPWGGLGGGTTSGRTSGARRARRDGAAHLEGVGGRCPQGGVTHLEGSGGTAGEGAKGFLVHIWGAKGCRGGAHLAWPGGRAGGQTSGGLRPQLEGEHSREGMWQRTSGELSTS